MVGGWVHGGWLGGVPPTPHPPQWCRIVKRSLGVGGWGLRTGTGSKRPRLVNVQLTSHRHHKASSNSCHTVHRPLSITINK